MSEKDQSDTDTNGSIDLNFSIDTDEELSNIKCNQSNQYDFTGYQELLEILRTKYDEISETHLARKNFAEKRLRLILVSATIFVSVVSTFNNTGIYPLNKASASILGGLTAFTATSLAATLYFLSKFLIPIEMKTLDFSPDQWGKPSSRVSNQEEVKKMLDSMSADFIETVNHNKDKNDELGKIYEHSTYGLITYFLLLTVLIIAITAVKF